MIETAMSSLEDVRDEETEAFDNMPESLQLSDRGSAMEDAISAMEDSVTYLEDVVELLEDVAE